MNNTVLAILAYKAGLTYSKAQNVPGNQFFGGMNIADAIGFERGSLEHSAATSGAMEHIHTLDVITNNKGTLI